MLTTYTIYADVLFLLNFLMDFFLLAATGRFLRRPLSYPRLLLAAAIGACYGVGVIFPGLEIFYSLVLKIAFSLLLLRVAFPYEGWQRFFGSVGAFYLIAFAMAGAVMGGSSLLAGAGIEIGSVEVVRWSSLVFAVVMAAVLGRKGVLWLKNNWHKEDFRTRVEIIVGSHKVSVGALIDTGNDLRDPVSTLPVVVIQYQAVQTLLPQGLRTLFEQYGDSDPPRVLQDGCVDGWEKRLRLIPFASIGRKHGMMVGFRPDQLYIYGEDKRCTDQVIVAVTRQDLGSGQDYRAIINPDILTIAHKVYLPKGPKEVRV